MTDTASELLEYANQLHVIDAHEHLIGEATHLKRYLSFFDFIASYLQWDLHSAGMPKDLLWKYPQSAEESYSHFLAIEPYWKFVRHGSYARPMMLTLKEFYGISELTRDNVLWLGEQLNADNSAGLYDRVFDKSKIKRIINQSPDHPFDDPRFVYGKPIDYYDAASLVPFLSAQPNAALEDLLEQVEAGIRAAVARGAKSAKVFSVFLMQSPDRKAAQSQLEALQAGQTADLSALQTVIYDHTIALCGQYGIVATVHTGVWTDLNKQNPALIFPVVERHPNVTFDVYHMGIPFVRSCAFLGKSYPNVHLNLCWSHAVSERMTLNALDEWLDLVPVNKIIGFGGDLITLPQHVWGQLQVAKENIANALAIRIKRQRLDSDSAKEIMELWFHDNPERIYKL